jgi:antitoxin VapB
MQLTPPMMEYILVYMSTIAKLFINGGSQAVRLPKEFRFDGDEVRVRRLGRGVVLEPVTPSSWPAGYWARMPLIEDAEWTRPDDPPPQRIERERDLP